MAGDLVGVREHRQDVDKTEHLDLEVVVFHHRLHQVGGKPAATKAARVVPHALEQGGADLLHARLG